MLCEARTVIVGAGPTGLTAAVSLVARGRAGNPRPAVRPYPLTGLDRDSSGVTEVERILQRRAADPYRLDTEVRAALAEWCGTPSRHATAAPA
jgi:hypothetical protein